MLALQPGFSVEDQAFMKKLEELNLDQIAFILRHPQKGYGWDHAQTVLAIARYKMFLFLNYKHPECQLVPTREIDEVWHQHILDTQKYAQDCQTLFDYFLHHFPYFGIRGEADRQNWEMAFTQTQSLFRKYFGVHLLGETYLQKPSNINLSNEALDSATCIVACRSSK